MKMYFFRKKSVQLLVVLLTLIATPRQLTANNFSFLSNTILNQSINSDTTYSAPKSLPSGRKIKLFSSSSMIVINQVLKQVYEEKYPDAQVEITRGDTSELLEVLLKGETDLVALGRRLTAEEKNQGLVEVPINRGKIAIVVASDNPFQENLSFEKFAQIFRGEITNWSKLGGPQLPIRLIDRPESSDTREALKSYDVFKKSPFMTGRNAIQLSEDDTAVVIKELGKNGISYAIMDQVLNRENVRIIPMHKTLPTNPLYPYSQPRNFVYKNDTASPEVLAFLGLVTSEDGQKVVAKADKQGRSDLANLSSTNQANSSEIVTSPSLDPQIKTELNKQEKTNSETFGGLVTAFIGDIGKETGTKRIPWWILLLLNVPILGALLWVFLRRRGNQSVGTGETRVVPGTTTNSDFTPVGETLFAEAEVTEANDLTETSSENGNEVAVVDPSISVTGVEGVGELLATWASLEKNSQISLSLGESQTVLASWSVPEADQLAAKLHGAKQYQLRVYDVTDIDLDSEPAHSLQEYNCDELTTQWEVENLESLREYQGEIGYLTNDGQWLKLARSKQVSISRPEIVVISETTNEISIKEEVESQQSSLALSLGGVGVGGLLATWTNLEKNSQISLSPGESQTVLASWSVPEADQLAAKLHGAKQYQLRVYDVTDIDLDLEPAESIKYYNFEDSNQQWQIGSLLFDREYQAEIGYATDDDRWLLLARSNRIRIDISKNADLGRAGQGFDKLLLRDITLEDYVNKDIEVVKEPDLERGERVRGVLLPCKVIITSDDAENMMVTWKVSQTAQNALKEQGGKEYQLRIYDVTDIDLDKQPAYNVQAYNCQESTQEMQVPVLMINREYQAEIGYVTDYGKLLKLARSNRIRIPAIEIDDVKTTQLNVTQTKAVILEEALKSSWVIIVPVSSQSAYVHWGVSQTAKNLAKQQGGQQYQLRIFDITDIDIDSQNAQNVQQYDCDESSQKQEIPINVSSVGYVDYFAEIGYVTDDWQWLIIARCNPLRIPVLI
ncbi:MAG: DUF4912 domain-containing protein [Trichodesmium sp. St4_bin8_1]|nr:DUF4912 domain-containing protein [Trichodesmium sp. St4_bin8_1]